MKKIFPILLILTLLFGCKSTKNAQNSKYDDIDTTKRLTFNRVLKCNNYNIKYQKAKEYYGLGKYIKAQDLFEQIIPFYKGQTRGAEVHYLFAMCNYKTGDNLLAGYLFQKFYQMYPTTDYSENALFLSAYCYYLDSPRPSLDQESTNTAIEQFQMFVTKFPKSNLIDSCNNLVDKLRFKLEEKTFEAAKLYYDIGYFKAAGIAFQNSLKKYPDSHYREDVLYYIAKSDVKYADGSVLEKQKERYLNTVSSCKDYKKQYPNGKYTKEINKTISYSQKRIKKLEK